MLLLVQAILVLKVLVNSDCANILGVFPTPSISHQVVFRPLINELVKRGHHVTVITTDPAHPKGQSHPNLTEIDLHDLSYKMWNTFVSIEKGKEDDAQSHIKFIFELLNSVFEEQMKSAEVQELINDRKKTFDLLFIESCIRPAISFSHVYKVPVIEISSFSGIYDTFDTTGAPTNPLVYPLVTRQRINDLTLMDKISELYTQYKAESIYRGLVKSENEMIKKIFGKDTPDIKKLKRNVQMIFLNVHPLWDSNRPAPPNVIYLGGLHQKPSKQLPEDLKLYLDSSKNGVIYMSFGTNVKPSLLPAEKIKIFTNVFSKLPYDILWKWDKDEVPGCSNNIRISKWFPQSDLLKHPKVKVFITQGGLQSTDEAITAGVPLIGIPMLGDQWYNVEMYVKYKIGLKLGIETISEDKLKNAIENVIQNESYHQNIVQLRNIMRDQPQTPLERAVWWTEHVLRHGNAEHLRSPAAHMHWTEYYALDLLLICLIVITVILSTSLSIIYYLYNKIVRNLIFKPRKTKTC